MKTAIIIGILFIAEGMAAKFGFTYPEKMNIVAITGLMLAVLSDIIDMYKKLKEE